MGRGGLHGNRVRRRAGGRIARHLPPPGRAARENAGSPGRQPRSRAGPYTNRNKLVSPSLPASEDLLWMELENGNLRLDEADRRQYLIASDRAADDGRHGEEIPIVKARDGTIVGVVHLHWDRYRQLQYMHVKEHMLGPGKYAITFTHPPWAPIVKTII
jgi:hypothetical protein